MAAEAKKEPDDKAIAAVATTTIKLRNGDAFPTFAYGTSWRYGINAYWGGYQHTILNGEMKDTHKRQEAHLEQCMVSAIKHGYKAIDTAQGYSTEHIVGNILRKQKQYKIQRSDIFIISKLGSKERTIGDCKRSIEQSLKLLHTPYIDLYLIHSPHSNDGGLDVLDIYAFLLKQYKAKGIIRSLGVSNFSIHHLECIASRNLELPSVNQIAFSCFFRPKALVAFCTKHDIVVQGYSPLCKASEVVTKNETLLQIADKYGKSWGDVCLKYCFQKSVAITCHSGKEHECKSQKRLYSETSRDRCTISTEISE